MSYGSDLLSTLIGFIPGAGMLVWGLVRALVPPSQRALPRWAARYAPHLSDVNRSLISRNLQRTRSLQMAGAGVGWIATGVFVTGTGQFVPLFGVPLMIAIAGYLLGAGVARASGGACCARRAVRSRAKARGNAERCERAAGPRRVGAAGRCRICGRPAPPGDRGTTAA